MKTYEDELKANGWKSGLWNDPWSKTFVSEEISKQKKNKIKHNLKGLFHKRKK